MTTTTEQPLVDSTPSKETKGDRTRALIKQIITEEVGRSGPMDVTLQDICSAANVTAGSFYFHFKNKDAALEETAADAIVAYYDSIAEIVSQPGTLPEQLDHIMAAFVDNYKSHGTRTRLIRMVVPSNDMARLVWEKERNSLAEQLEAMIINARHSDVGPDVSSYFTAEFLLTATESFLDNVFFGNNERLGLAVGSPELIIKNIGAVWERAILNDNRIGDYL
jgi:AcrR family transcriptional regulator